MAPTVNFLTNQSGALNVDSDFKSQYALLLSNKIILYFLSFEVCFMVQLWLLKISRKFACLYCLTNNGI